MPHFRLLPLPALVLLLLGGGPGGAAADPKEEAVRKELKTLEGKWHGVSGVKDNQELPLPRGGLQLAFSGNNWVYEVEGQVMSKGSCSVDPAKMPHAMDIMPTEGPYKGRTVLAVYELKGDELRIAFSEPGKDRPTDFSSKGSVVRTWKRAAP